MVGSGVLLVLLAVSGNLQANSLELPDPWLEVDRILGTSSAETTSLKQAAEIAIEILQTNLVENVPVLTILKQLVDLNNTAFIVSSSSSPCPSESVERFGAIHKSLQNYSKENPYKEPRSKLGIVALITSLQQKFAKSCFNYLGETLEFERTNRESVSESAAISIFAEKLLDGITLGGYDYQTSRDKSFMSLVKTSKGLHMRLISEPEKNNPCSWYRLMRDINKINRYNKRGNTPMQKHHFSDEIHVESVGSRFQETILTTCKYLTDQIDGKDLLKKTIRVAKAVNLTGSMISKSGHVIYLFRKAAGFQICSDLRTNGHGKLVKSIKKCSDNYI